MLLRLSITIGIDKEDVVSDSELVKIYLVLTNALVALRDAKPSDRSEMDRRWAITITEMEKVVAYYNSWILDPTGQR